MFQFCWPLWATWREGRGEGREKWVRLGREDLLPAVCPTIQSAGPAPGGDISRSCAQTFALLRPAVLCAQQLGWNHPSHKQLYFELTGLGFWRNIFIWHKDSWSTFLKDIHVNTVSRVLSAPLCQTHSVGGRGDGCDPCGFSHGLSLVLMTVEGWFLMAPVLALTPWAQPCLLLSYSPEFHSLSGNSSGTQQMPKTKQEILQDFE